MLTLVLATPRSGSNTFVDGLDVPVWMPEDHPGYGEHNEYYNMGNDLDKVSAERMKLFFHVKLTEHIEKFSGDHICVKVLVGQVRNQYMKYLLSQAQYVRHTVRLNYTDQLKSLVAAITQNIWLDNRHTSQRLIVPQKLVDSTHEFLISNLKSHAEIYHSHGGEISVLENRSQNPYNNRPEFPDCLSWPSFDTAGLFGL